MVLVARELLFLILGRTSRTKMPNPVSLPEFIGICGGVGLAMLMNLSQRKPMATGIYKHVALGALGYLGGQQLDKLNQRKERERLLIMEDYIRLHPEDFPEEVPKKYGDILMKWYPVR